MWVGSDSGGTRSDGNRYDPATDSWTAITTTGALYDPVANTWTPLPTAGAPAPRADATAVWTGQEVIVWGGMTALAMPLDTGSRFSPR